MTLEEALETLSDEGVRELVLTEPLWNHIIKDIYAHGLEIFPIPMEEGQLPTYGVTASYIG